MNPKSRKHVFHLSHNVQTFPIAVEFVLRAKNQKNEYNERKHQIECKNT
jgi:hypothetical protein